MSDELHALIRLMPGGSVRVMKKAKSFVHLAQELHCLIVTPLYTLCTESAMLYTSGSTLLASNSCTKLGSEVL